MQSPGLCKQVISVWSNSNPWHAEQGCEDKHGLVYGASRQLEFGNAEEIQSAQEQVISIQHILYALHV
jgi:hypothetical protein